MPKLKQSYVLHSYDISYSLHELDMGAANRMSRSFAEKTCRYDSEQAKLQLISPLAVRLFLMSCMESCSFGRGLRD